MNYFVVWVMRGEGSGDVCKYLSLAVYPISMYVLSLRNFGAVMRLHLRLEAMFAE